MKKNITAIGCFASLIFSLFALETHGQQIASIGFADIQGRVIDQAGESLPGAHVIILEVNQATAADSDGHYQFTKIPSGNYTLAATAVGFNRLEQEVVIRNGEKITFDFVLKVATMQLQAVEIIGRKEQTYKNTNTFTGTKTETPLKYVPQAISYVTKEVIDDRQAFKNSDVVKNISGVNQSAYDNQDFVIRGFSAGTRLINGLRMTSSGWNQSLLPNMEKIEVIKGPASALYSNTRPGGTINSVTKKPLDETRKAINFATGSYNTFRITSDFTGPMNENKSLLYRLNLAYQNAGSFRMLQGGQDIVIAPSFSFIPNDKTMVNFDFVYSATHGKLDRGQAIFGAAAGTDLYSTPISFALGKSSDYQKETNMYSTISILRKITDHVKLNASYMKYMYNENLLEHRTSNRYGMDADGNSIPNLMEMQTINRTTRNYTDNLNLYMIADLKTGAVEHTVLAGYDHILYQSPIGNSNYNASGFINADSTGVVLSKSGSPAAYDPKNKAQYLIRNNMPVPNVPYFDLENPDYSKTDISRYFNRSTASSPSRYYVNGIYIQEQLKWGKFQALLSLRQEYYTDLLNYTLSTERKVKQQALIPRIGLVYTPIEPVTFYGAYTEGYQPQSAATIGAPEIYGGPFDPLISNMIEGGAKMELLSKRLAVNVAVYRIEQNNVLMNANAEDNPDLLRQIGQQRAQGVELDVYGQVTANLSLTANIAFNSAKITKSSDPQEIGEVFPNAPKNQGGFWAKYSFSNTLLKGIGIGLGSNFSAEKIQSSEITLPSYVVFDAAIYYNVDKFKLSVNLNNAFDKTHWLGGTSYQRLYPGTPRNFLVGVGYIF